MLYLRFKTKHKTLSCKTESPTLLRHLQRWKSHKQGAVTELVLCWTRTSATRPIQPPGTNGSWFATWIWSESCYALGLTLAAGAVSPKHLKTAAWWCQKTTTSWHGGSMNWKPKPVDNTLGPATRAGFAALLQTALEVSPGKKPHQPPSPTKILSCPLKHLLARDVQPCVCHRFLSHTGGLDEFLWMGCTELKCTIGWEHPIPNRL